MAYDDKNVTMEGVRIIFRNFSGKEGQYNREGDRNFAVLLDEKTAKAMEKDGFNVKVLQPREEGDEPQPYLPVAVNFKGRPPRVVMITSRGRTNLDEESVGALDYADIINVDLIVRPYEWAVSGKSGVKAYLQSIYVTIQEDALELKYADLNPATDEPATVTFQ
jgi:hypothetical protein